MERASAAVAGPAVTTGIHRNIHTMDSPHTSTRVLSQTHTALLRIKKFSHKVLQKDFGTCCHASLPCSGIRRFLSNALLGQRLAHRLPAALRPLRVPADKLAEQHLHHIELGDKGGGGAELEGLLVGPAQQDGVGVGAGGELRKRVTRISLAPGGG